MSWTDQMQEATRSWVEMQKRMVDQWGALARAVPAAAGQGPWDAWFAQWQEQAKQAMESWSRGAPGLPPQAVEKLFLGEELYFRFLSMVTEGLKALSPRIEAGEDWVELLRQLVDQMKEDLAQPPAKWMPSADTAAAFAREVPEFWRLYWAETHKMVAPWVESVRDARGHLGEAIAGDRRAAIKMFNLFMDTYESTLGRFLAAPAIGYTRELQEKVTRTYETWVELQRCQIEFQTEVANAGIRALENLLRELVERGEKGEQITSLRQLFDLWVACAERAYFEIASTESFAEIQGKLVNAAMHYRVHERELAEVFVKAMHMPTRGELDDAYRHIHELRREVKRLRREMEDLRENQPAPAPAPATRRKPATRSKSPAKAQQAKSGPDTEVSKEG